MKPQTSQTMAWLCLLFSCFTLSAQQIPEIKIKTTRQQAVSKVAQLVFAAEASGASFQEVNVLALSHQPTSLRMKEAAKVKVLELQPVALRMILQQTPENISLAIPKNEREQFYLKLIKVNPVTEGFQVYTSSQEKIPFPYKQGLHYRGIVEGDEVNSIASVSIFENEIIGSFTHDGGNMVIQPSYEKANELILYNDKDITPDAPYACYSDQLEQIKKPIQSRGAASLDNCVRVYIECDYALFQNKGSTTNTVNWMTAVFNNIATLYANESINTSISEIFVWTTADSYNRSNAVTALNQFRSARPTFNGDIAHLAALGGVNLGGVAWLDVLCSSYKYAYSNISSSYLNVPNFSWTVEVMTHEMGHNLGSNHTQWCGWTGGALDNCYTTEGGCSAGPAPTNGGTIMSYCHLTSYGINFNNGFGVQPGNKIRSDVSTASCLSTACSGGGSGCSTPVGLSTSNITQTSALSNWNPVSGASAYSFEYKTNSASSWTSVTTSNPNYSLSGLTANTLYNTRVKSNCTSGASTYSTIINFTTPGDGICSTPGNLSVSNLTTSTATISWNTVAGATSYNFQYKLSSATAWSQVIVSSPVVNITGMTPATTYHIRIQAVCNNGFSDFSNVLTITSLSGYCASKAQNSNYEWIKRVKLGSIDRTSGKDGGYYYASNLGTELIKGSNNTVYFQSGTSGSSGSLYWKIWIDFNNNNSFDDAGEQVASVASSSMELLSSNFTVPHAAASAYVRMRVSMKYGGFATPCMNFTYGEVEDYIVKLKVDGSGDVCNSPKELLVNSVTTTTAIAEWPSVPEAGSYTFEYKLNSSVDWNSFQTTSPNYNITGLSPNTIYDAQVKTICSFGSSAYTAKINFKTKEDICNPPSNLTASDIGQSNAKISWHPVDGATSYLLEYRDVQSHDWRQIQSTTAYQFISGLSPQTLYIVRIKALCSGGASDNSTEIEFRTLEPICGIPANLTTLNVTENSAKVLWNQVSGAESYGVQFKNDLDPDWREENVTTPYIHLTGLAENTKYYVRVKSICSFGSSDFSNGIYFVTASATACDKPGSLTVSNVTASTANASWTAITGASSYNVLYKIASTDNWVTKSATNNSLNLSGLTPGTHYNIKVQAVCSGGQSEFTSLASFTTAKEYCNSKGQSTTYEWIKRVNLGNIDRTSSKDGGYYNGTALSTNIAKGSDQTINYQCGRTSTSGVLYWRVWIDFNNNNSFEDPGEMIVSLTSGSTGLLSTNFKVPASAATASVRMRVSLKYNGYATPCMTFSYGEVEDYTINIIETGGFIDPDDGKAAIDNIKVYPNPFSKNFSLDFTASKDQEVQLVIMDPVSRILFDKVVKAHEGLNTYRFDSGDFKPATYIIQVKSAHDSYFRKILKLE